MHTRHSVLMHGVLGVSHGWRAQVPCRAMLQSTCQTIRILTIIAPGWCTWRYSDRAVYAQVRMHGTQEVCVRGIWPWEHAALHVLTTRCAIQPPASQCLTGCWQWNLCHPPTKKSEPRAPGLTVQCAWGLMYSLNKKYN